MPRNDVNRPPTPEPEDSGPAELTVEEEIQVKLEQTGERERLKQVLRENLETCGWKDQIRVLAQEEAHKRSKEALTIEELVKAIKPRGRAAVPDSVKADLLARIRTVLQS